MTRWEVSSTTLPSLLVLLITCQTSIQYKVVADAQDDIPRRRVFYSEQTIAVLDFDDLNVVRNCNVIEVYEKSEAVTKLSEFEKTGPQPRKITFREMISLMDYCDAIDRAAHPENKTSADSFEMQRNYNNYYTLLSGILPGTKWCGLGDLAQDYYDIGTFASVDRCCRSHDLCPVKVRAYKKRYGLMNSSFFSKSHCDCDEIFYNCLKAQNHKVARVMGKIYFNVMRVSCIEEVPAMERSPDAPKLRFVVAKKVF